MKNFAVLVISWASALQYLSLTDSSCAPCRDRPPQTDGHLCSRNLHRFGWSCHRRVLWGQRLCVCVCLSEALVLLIVREEVKKGKRDQRRHLGMQTDEEKIRSLWQSFILSAITLMWNLGRRKCLCVVIPECWAFWPNSPGGGGNKNGTETLWDWLRLVSINKHSNNLTWT